MPEQPPWSELDTFIELMSGRNRPVMSKILEDHRQLFQQAKGSRSNHHAWPGGYWDHISECLNLARAQYRLWNSLRPLEYSLAEALEVLFVHDIEKPWKYVAHAPCPISVPDLSLKPERAAWRLTFLQYYGVVFTARQDNALEFCEGESTDYRPNSRMMGPLAHLCHTCDETSARQFPGHPHAHADTWAGAHRVAAHDGLATVTALPSTT